MIKRHPKVTQKEVFNTASALVAKGYDPTLANVRSHLGNRGSQTTLHKYLKEWKQNCLKSAIEGEGQLIPSNALVEEKRVLEQALRQQRTQNEQYSEALIKAEKEAFQLKAENQSLKNKVMQLQEELKEMSSLKSHFEILFEEIKAERNALYEKEMAEKNKLIEALQEELKMVNQQAILEFRNAGYERDDAVMQERVKIINLQEKIIKISEENKALLEELKQEKQSNFEIKLKQSQTNGEVRQYNEKEGSI